MDLSDKNLRLKQACRLPDEALLFLAVLGRFEYALAELGYGENGRYGLCIDQDRFCDERYRDVIHEVIIARNVAKEFRATPPLIAGIDQEQLKWLPRPRLSHPRELIQALWNFRFQLNAPSVLGDAYFRNLVRLSLDAIDILHVILEFDDEIAHHFFERKQ